MWCAAVYYTATHYSDLSCTTLVSEQSYFLGCATLIDSPDTVTDYSTALTCSTAATPPTP